MLLGNAISGVALGTNHVLSQVVYIPIRFPPFSRTPASALIGKFEFCSYRTIFEFRGKSMGNWETTSSETRPPPRPPPNNKPNEVQQLLLHPRQYQRKQLTKDSVIGLVSIPGMMTGAILGGASISQAVKYQQIIMFLISATTTLAVTTSVVVCLIVCIDSNHRLRPDRVSSEKPWMWRLRDDAGHAVWKGAVYSWRWLTCRAHIPDDEEVQEGRRNGTH